MTQIHFKEVLRAIRDDLLYFVEVREPLDSTRQVIGVALSFFNPLLEKKFLSAFPPWTGWVILGLRIARRP